MRWCVAASGIMRNAVRAQGRMAFRITLILAVGYAEVRSGASIGDDEGR
jgi:hypothetical protein